MKMRSQDKFADARCTAAGGVKKWRFQRGTRLWFIR
jgi:hypothetical protein